MLTSKLKKQGKNEQKKKKKNTKEVVRNSTKPNAKQMMSKVSPEKREKWYNLENSVELMEFILGL